MFKKVEGFYPLEVTEKGVVRNSITGNILKHSKDSSGYPRVSWGYKCKSRVQSVHRLLAITFIPNPENKPQVNHKDSNRDNYNISNLEWCTAKENAVHGVNYGSIKTCKARGTDCNFNKYSEDKIREACILLTKGYRQVDIAKIVGIGKNLVNDIKRGRSWTHISTEYFPSELHLPKKSKTLSVESVKWVCSELQKGTKGTDIVKKSNVKYTQVIRIKNRTAYWDISKDYKW